MSSMLQKITSPPKEMLCIFWPCRCTRCFNIERSRAEWRVDIALKQTLSISDNWCCYNNLPPKLTASPVNQLTNIQHLRVLQSRSRAYFRASPSQDFSYWASTESDLKTQGSVVFPLRATRGAPADGPRMNFVISMGLPSFFLDSWNCLRKNNYMNDQF